MAIKYIIPSFLLLYFSIVLTQPSLKTPLERSGYTSLSSHQDMMTYLQGLSKSSPLVSMKIIGESVEGRSIPALFFSSDKAIGTRRDTKPFVLIFCQQHGDEPSGKEAALVLAREITQSNSDLLHKLDLVLVPQMNPDGSEKGERKNANGMDLNRNHVILSEPETRALHQLFSEWMPEVTLDVHEYSAVSEKWVKQGFIKNVDVQLGKVSNANIAAQIYDYSARIFIPSIGSILKNQGYTFHEYLVGTPFEGSRLRYSTTAVNDGRQSFGIFNTFSFIQEGIQFGDLITRIDYRVNAQVSALIAFLTTVGQNTQDILQIIRETRQQILENDRIKNPRVFIQMDYYPDSTMMVSNFPIFDLLTWQKEERALENFQGKVKVRKSIEKPVAYVIPASENRLLEVLSRHRIEMNPLTEKRTLQVFAYQIMHVTTFQEEENDVPYVDVQVKNISRDFEKGSMIIYLSQPAGNLLPLLLEPQSRFSLCGENSGRKYNFSEYLKENSEYPIYRLMEQANLHHIKGEKN